MNSTDIIDALGLPAECSVDQRVTKKLLVENGAPTAADKRKINDEIEELRWIASLQTKSAGVPEYRDQDREYLEVQILSLVLREKASASRLIELVHRAIPYPILLVTEADSNLQLSAAHLRWSQAEGKKTVIEDRIISVAPAEAPNETILGQFIEALALKRQPRDSMYTLYQGWVDTLLAFQAACITGTYSAAKDSEHAQARDRALVDYARLERDITKLRAAAKKQKQTPKLVEINLELKRLQAELTAARGNL